MGWERSVLGAEGSGTIKRKCPNLKQGKGGKGKGVRENAKVR